MTRQFQNVLVLSRFGQMRYSSNVMGASHFNEIKSLSEIEEGLLEMFNRSRSNSNQINTWLEMPTYVHHLHKNVQQRKFDGIPLNNHEMKQIQNTMFYLENGLSKNMDFETQSKVLGVLNTLK